MYRGYDTYTGTPARVYRSVGEIRSEMKDISEKIRKANESLNLRSLLLDMINEERITPESCAIWIPELESAIGEARAAYNDLSELSEELCDLREELRETRCALGV